MIAPQPTSVSLLRRLLRDSLASPLRLILGVVSVAALGVTQLLLTWLVKQWLEGSLVTGDVAALRRQLSDGAALIAIGTVAMCSSRYLVSDANQALLMRLRDRALTRLLVLDYPVARAHPTGDLVARLLHDVNSLGGFLETVVRRLVREATVGVGALVMLFVLKWRLALATATLVPITIALLARIGGLIRRWRTLAHTGVGSLGALLNEQLHGLSTVKGFQTEAFEFDRFSAMNRAVRRRIMRAEAWAVSLLAVVFLLTGLGLLATVWYGTRELTAGVMTQAELLAFCLYAAQTVEPLRRLSEIHGFMQSSVAAAARVYDIIDLPGEEASDGLALRKPVGGAVAFEGVGFAYREGQQVLHRFDLTIAAREQVAIVGATGCGKTTLTRLLIRFYRPQQGRVTLDGLDLTDLAVSDLRRAVCVIEQEPFLFSGPLADNIRYGSSAASRREIEHAAALAGLTPVLARLPRGLDTLLTESGHELSGGEKQRVALARALVRDPRVLVLDEATSALDGDTEAEIFRALEPWLRGRTVIAIGHRLSMVGRFPRIVLLQRGGRLADGSLERLVQTCPAFVTLFAEQLSLSGSVRQ